MAQDSVQADREIEGPQAFSSGHPPPANSLHPPGSGPSGIPVDTAHGLPPLSFKEVGFDKTCILNRDLDPGARRRCETSAPVPQGHTRGVVVERIEVTARGRRGALRAKMSGIAASQVLFSGKVAGVNETARVKLPFESRHLSPRREQSPGHGWCISFARSRPPRRRYSPRSQVHPGEKGGERALIGRPFEGDP